jgi:hypothetical protein
LAELISEVPLMDDEFYKERARHIREVATQADPFIKKRLLRLASNYDAMTTRPRVTVLSNLPDACANSFAENDRGHEE